MTDNIKITGLDNLPIINNPEDLLNIEETHRRIAAKVADQLTIDSIKHVSKEIDCVHYSLAGIAELTRIIGNYQLSYHQHLNAYKLFYKFKDYRGIVWAFEGIAQILKNTGYIEKATSLFAESIKISKSISDYRGLGYALKCFGECLVIKGNLKDGMYYLNEAESVFRRIQHNTGLAYTLKAMGDTLRDFYMMDEATILYQKAESIFLKIKEERGLAYVETGRGIMELRKGDVNLAILYFQNSLRVFREKRIKFGINLIKRSLSTSSYSKDLSNYIFF